MFRSRRDKGRDQVRHRGRVVDLSASRSRPRSSQSARPARSGARRFRAFSRRFFGWAKLGIVVAAALFVAREQVHLDLRGVPGLGWLAEPAEHGPIRAAINVRAERADCQVARVIDGDTVDLECGGGDLMRTRLMGYDTPEVYSPKCDAERALGNRATQALERRVNGSRRVLVDFHGTDRYGRHLARLTLDGTNVAEPLIEAGLARPYEGGRRKGWCG